MLGNGVPGFRNYVKDQRLHVALNYHQEGNCFLDVLVDPLEMQSNWRKGWSTGCNDETKQC
jgi:hypothetical protein